MALMKRLLLFLQRLLRGILRFLGISAPPKELPQPLTRIRGRKVKPEPIRIDPSQGGPNAPIRQPCTCFSWVKRIKKTPHMAYYYCGRCHITSILSLG